MKEIRMLLLLVALVGVIDSCTKTETKNVTSAATANGILLAGTTGQSKSWKLSSISQSKNGGANIPASGIPTCESDNVYKFSNNSTQSYEATENTVCTTGDPTTVETGTWAFTDDGKTLLIEGSTNVTDTEIQSTDHDILFYLVLTQWGPLSVTQISDSSVTLTYSFTYNTDKYVMTVVLAKA